MVKRRKATKRRHVIVKDVVRPDHYFPDISNTPAMKRKNEKFDGMMAESSLPK